MHISTLADRFVKDPHEVVKSGDLVKVKVLEIDRQRKRVALIMRLSEPTERLPTAEPVRERQGARQPQGPKARPSRVATALRLS